MRRCRRALPTLCLLAGMLAAVAQTATAASTALNASVTRSARAAGGSAGVYVFDVSTGRALASLHADTNYMPASVEKLFTTSTALRRFGPDTRLTTTIAGTGRVDRRGVYHGNLYLRGEGDPTFGSRSFTRRAYGAGATLETLARRLVRSLGLTRVRGRIVGDESYFDTRRGTAYSGWGPSWDISGVLTGLAYDRGLSDERGAGYQTSPAAFAAAKLDAALGALKVPVSGAPTQGRTPRRAAVVAKVRSPTMATIVRLTNQPSDNYFAEMLLKGLGARFGGGGTTARGAAVVRAALARWGLHPTIYDGSGLLRSDHTTPRTVVHLLRRMQADPAAAAFEASLPVAGRSGTLADRMRGTAAQGRCHAKTGTLSDVTALAGYCHARGGHLLAFAILMNRVDVSRGRSEQDRIVARLAAYRGARLPRHKRTAPPRQRPAPRTTPAPAPTPNAPRQPAAPTPALGGSVAPRHHSTS